MQEFVPKNHKPRLSDIWNNFKIEHAYNCSSKLRPIMWNMHGSQLFSHNTTFMKLTSTFLLKTYLYCYLNFKLNKIRKDSALTLSYLEVLHKWSTWGTKHDHQHVPYGNCTQQTEADALEGFLLGHPHWHPEIIHNIHKSQAPFNFAAFVTKVKLPLCLMKHHGRCMGKWRYQYWSSGL
jgi:UDP-2,3-diacylglucosamine pyrophosphatase LpxH